MCSNGEELLHIRSKATVNRKTLTTENSNLQKLDSSAFTE